MSDVLLSGTSLSTLSEHVSLGFFLSALSPVVILYGWPPRATGNVEGYDFIILRLNVKLAASLNALAVRS